ncbi:dephospho-CoA kinase [Hyphobacterium marinum]|uniref:Dephospho-CoA kinase n=1 Tax=Hyphobacterium marinum TaxID=3116574 RepID=A0ABU7LUZ2_9PROT|nr:dephospho-CoA kinase [Hyphobacterium sp. Y6023]MEE2565379.1 dephospho-CoA kinase [Hyphobacterium sp. Y6023]
MITVGLTGSIGMGKSTTARLFAEAGVPVFDADAAVHDLYAPGGAAVEPVSARFPGVLRGGGIDRASLSEALKSDPGGFADLEAIVHPLVGAARAAFLEAAEAAGAALCVLDIPLLFETGQQDAYDVIVVVSAPADIQADRVLARPGMTREKFEAILARQTPDSEKRARADFIIDSSAGIADARRQVGDVIAALKAGANRPKT